MSEGRMNMGTRWILATLVTLPLWAGADQTSLADQAQQLAEKYLLADTHIDVPYRLEDGWVDVTRATEGGDFDYPRAKAGGLDLVFMSVFAPASMETADGDASEAHQLAHRLIDSVEALAARAPDKFMLVNTPVQAEEARKLGRIGLAMGMENASPINHELGNIRRFAERGISYITLAHGKSNHICDSSYDENRRWNGLSPFGKEVVGEMNRLGVMIDISHVTDDTFFQVIELSSAPVIASHSSPRHFTAGWERNMSDEMIEALAKNGGVIQINVGSSFIKQEAHEWFNTMAGKRRAYLQEHGLPPHGDAASKWGKEYRVENPFPYATLDDVMNNFEHVIQLVGIEHVGIGSDFDGVGDSLPIGFKDVSQYPALIAKFLERGYSEGDIRAVMGGNLMRVWREVRALAGKAEK
jgi:membrane dipeptidase